LDHMAMLEDPMRLLPLLLVLALPACRKQEDLVAKYSGGAPAPVVASPSSSVFEQNAELFAAANEYLRLARIDDQNWDATKSISYIAELTGDEDYRESPRFKDAWNAGLRAQKNAEQAEAVFR